MQYGDGLTGKKRFEMSTVECSTVVPAGIARRILPPRAYLLNTSFLLPGAAYLIVPVTLPCWLHDIYDIPFNLHRIIEHCYEYPRLPFLMN